MASEQRYDVIVIGAGLGGLLSAAQFLRRGQRVAVVERLAHPGGRFTAKTFHGAQVSTGAVHMLPFGTNGELAGMLRALAIPHHVHDSEVFASFHARGRQYVCRSVVQMAQVFGTREFPMMVRLGAIMMLRPPRPQDRHIAFCDWLEPRAPRARYPLLHAFFERVAHFALSVDIDQISYGETVETTRNMFRYGAPGVVEGGCAAITGELERRVRENNGALLLQHDVLAIERDDEGAATGVRVRDRSAGNESLLRAPLIVSNIGPRATNRLLGAPTATDEVAQGTSEAEHPPREACGLKVHLLSDESIIPHRGIMYCLDTDRIAGVVQPSNSDRRLAPPGKHLLITHQLMRSDDVNVEREAARADLYRLFGEAFGTTVNILTMSQYRGEWPVNRAVQGEDVIPATHVPGLYLVGDAVKPSGYLMVEGVAQSVNALMDAVERLAGTPRPSATTGAARAALRAPQPVPARHTPAKPSSLRALHWLVSPPPPHAGS